MKLLNKSKEFTLMYNASDFVIPEGEFEVGFMLYPSDINEIKLLADNNLIMPPKSTYIEPKFRSGLVVYEL